MAEAQTKLPVKKEQGSTEPGLWRPFESLRREVDRLFEDFDRSSWLSPFRRSEFDVEPFWRRELAWGILPAIDVTEKTDAYEVTAELPGLDEKNIEVRLSDSSLTIKGEKEEEKEEKKKEYHIHERHFGSFQRCLRLPEGVDSNKIQASFKKGVLTVTLPKKPEAQKPEKKIEVKAA
jgi:HSP20 family protein